MVRVALSFLLLLTCGALARAQPRPPAVDPDRGQPPRTLFSAGRIDLYIACHPASDCAAVSALYVAIAQLRRNGELADFGTR